MKRCTAPARQHGIAAITAMLVVAIATLLATELIWDLNLSLRRTETLLARDQAREIALGLELLAVELLQADLEDDGDIPVDSLDEAWAQPYAFPFEGGTVAGQLEDLQGRFNLNRLVNPGDPASTDLARQQFRRLVELAAADLDVSPDTVVDSVVDWLDPDQQPSLGGAEDGLYTGRTPPYRSANFWFTTPSELLAVNGVNPALYNNLAGLVTALPKSGGQSSRAGQINVNTAQPLVLQAMSPEVTVTAVEDWVANREGEPYAEVMEFWESAVTYFPDAQAENPLQFIEISSSYFGLTVNVSIGTTRLAMYSLLERSEQGVVVRLRAFDTN